MWIHSDKWKVWRFFFTFLISNLFFYLFFSWRQHLLHSLGLSGTYCITPAELEFVVILLPWFLKVEYHGHVPPNPPRKLLKIKNITDIFKSSSLEDKVRTISQKGKEKGRIRNNTCFDNICTRRRDRKYQNQLRMTNA